VFLGSGLGPGGRPGMTFLGKNNFFTRSCAGAGPERLSVKSSGLPWSAVWQDSVADDDELADAGGEGLLVLAHHPNLCAFPLISLPSAILAAMERTRSRDMTGARHPHRHLRPATILSGIVYFKSAAPAANLQRNFSYKLSASQASPFGSGGVARPRPALTGSNMSYEMGDFTTGLGRMGNGLYPGQADGRARYRPICAPRRGGHSRQ
jgi:hypothetical protein